MNSVISTLNGISRWFAGTKRFLSLVFGTVLFGLFAYWVVRYWMTINSLLKNMGGIELIGLGLVVVVSAVVTVFVLVVLLKSKGYDFGFLDGYYALNIAQLASMIPGGVWGFAGFAGALWSKGISKPDSAIVIFVNTLVMLTACAVVGFSGLASVLGDRYMLLVFAPFLGMVLSRNRLELLRQKNYPATSSLPSIRALLSSLLLGVLVWILVGLCFAAFLYRAAYPSSVPLLVVLGAYTTGYLGGYLAIFAPSGIGVSEGLTALLLSSYLPVEQTLAVGVTFRIFHTLIVWLNLMVALMLHSRKHSQATS
jgi:hypothetical protein